MANTFKLFIVFLVFSVFGKCASECVNVETSEGIITLQNGERACAPLQENETEADKGLRFVTCHNTVVSVQSCPTGLRYDTRNDICNWPNEATCQREGGNTGAPPSTQITTTTTPRSMNTSSSSSSSSLTETSNSQPPPSTTKQPPAGPCNATNCRLPDCFCYGHKPTGIPQADLPMFVMLTWDDHVSTAYYDKYYRNLVVDNMYKLFNPNGCRPKFAFYVNHDNTDYSKVKALWEAGHEIGSHTFHHRLPEGDKESDYPEMVAEIQGIKEEILRQTGSKGLYDSIVGFRAPYLRVGRNVQYDVLRDYGFLYDTSILNINILQGREPYWPYTLDFTIDECVAPPCPTKTYPGMYQVPLNGWIGDDGSGCSMTDACLVGSSSWQATDQQWYDFYKRNFEKYFYPVKVPMPIFIHGTMFDSNARSYTALVRWLQDTLQARSDVWLVSPRQVIEWMKNQLSNKDMIAKKWGC